MGDAQPDAFPGPSSTRYPNTRLRAVHDADQPAMADREDEQDANAADPDTCRICRGEGTSEEPLFYPCKCSGSIKYVHQDCLMEWLSHSQKKHCELCKTPFRFTKLYAPDMPKALPFHIFVSHMAKYMFRNLLVWLRALLVASVWLGWLPYLMRSVWSFLFWLSDEGLGAAALFGRRNAVAGAFDALSKMPSGSTACPSSPLFAATTSVATIGGVADGFDTMQLVIGMYNINLSSADPFYSTILRLFFGSVGLGDKPTATAANATALVEKALSRSHPSLLSEVKFLRNLTRHPSINRAVIATLEGQIITILVIVCFILIILVRDYVVQQQPDILRAAFAPVDAPLPQPRQVRVREVAEEEAAPAEPQPVQNEAPALPTLKEETHAGPSTERAYESLQTLRSAVPDERRDYIGENTAVHEYMTIYRLAGGDPERILRIAKELKMEDKLDYWIRLTRQKIDRDKGTDDEAEASEPAGSVAGLSTTAQAGTPSPSATSATGWFWSDDHPAQPGTPTMSVSTHPSEPDTSSTGWVLAGDEADDKGKGKAPERLDEGPVGSPLRPRANTDGPKVNNMFNPLANNSWSFPDRSRFPDPGPLPDLGQNSMPYPAEPLQDQSLQLLDQASSEHLGEPASEAPQPELVAQDNIPDTNIPPRQPEAPGGLLAMVADFMWADVAHIDPAELAPADIPDEFDDEDDGQDDVMIIDRMDMDDADDEAAGLDPEAIEDAEDLEGILELLGMRGPVAGLFQNAIFCAFLVSITIFLGVFVPYNIGRIAVWTVANPMRPARMLFSLTKFIQDCALIMFGVASAAASLALQTAAWFVGLTSVKDYFSPTTANSWELATNASNRIGASFVTELPIISASEMRNFSAISHEALLILKGHIGSVFSAIGQVFLFVCGGDSSINSVEILAVATNISVAAWAGIKSLPETVANPNIWVINLSVPEVAVTVDPELAYWNGMDRFWAIVCGYIAISMLAGLYLRRGTPFSSSQTGQEWEAAAIDGLNQASGVMKVILIIGIEMLVFPLYCGMLLDVALLPLFEDTTVRTRMLFAVRYPVTSIFVHWFVGTGYMFHFALFVSMCRKIMRKGVLYFIRDPDDPEFHPVRDVLERSVTTQLRKILFSAFVYGALVIVCLGGVVWGLALALPTVLPIHYSSNEPVLEFPVDLLFYNFLMPLAVRFFRPTEGLHLLYTWWFRKCARVLRITWFLFGERKVDEEGILALASDSPAKQLPWWKTVFLELDSNDEVVPKTWHDILEGGEAEPAAAIKTEDMIKMSISKTHLLNTGQLIPDGRFVRSPASDQVKIPKGQRVFQEIPGQLVKLDWPETGLYTDGQYQVVYVPPHFRARVFLFILFIWVFAAATGVGITIIPLMLGRQIFKLLIPDHIRTNDIYAFTIGVYLMSSFIYTLFHLRSIRQSATAWVSAVITSAYNRGVVQRGLAIALQVAKVAYACFVLFVLFPVMVASLMELYAVIPFHEFMYSSLLGGGDGSEKDLNPRHTIRVIQGWTVGLLYLRLGSRIITHWFGHTRIAVAVRAILRRGWLDPDITILTRAFVIPGLAIWTVAIAAPLLFAKFTIANGLAATIMQSSGASLADGVPSQQLHGAYLVLIYRLSFPLMALGMMAFFTLWSMVSIFRSWKIRIRDEAYLIGERLHNFGVVNGPPRARGAWRATGPRI